MNASSLKFHINIDGFIMRAKCLTFSAKNGNLMGLIGLCGTLVCETVQFGFVKQRQVDN